jgi:anti-anti-sigma factor
MALITRQKLDHCVIDLEGDLRINNFISFRNDLEFFLNSNTKFIDINLSKVKMIDSSNLRLLINAKKRLTEKNGDLFLFNLRDEIVLLLNNTNLTQVFKIFKNEEELDSFLITDKEDASTQYWAFTVPSLEPVRRIPLKCPVCGSMQVFGYSLSPEHQKKIWVGNYVLPFYEGLDLDKNSHFDRARITVCSECFMASVTPQDFALVNKEKEIKPSRLDTAAKTLLAKGISKRRKMMDTASQAVVGDKVFEVPRTDISVLMSYRLAEECARSLSLERTKADTFTLGYLNFLAAEYSPAEEKESHLDRARTWFSEVFKKPDQCGLLKSAEVYYYFLITCIRLKKKKEAREVYEKYSRFVSGLKDSLIQNRANFWFNQAKTIWQEMVKNDLFALQ